MMKRWLKRSVIFIGIITGLFITFLLFLHTAAGKSLVQQKLENFLEKKFGTAITIGNVNYRLPNWILLEKVMIGDRSKDTLLTCGRLYVGIKMLKLLSDVVDVSGLRLEDVGLRCHRGANDSAFNFQFILDAFTPAEKTKNSKENETPLRLSVKQLSLNRIKLSVTDESEQLYLSAFINELSIRPGTLFPEKNRFGFIDLTFPAAHQFLEFIIRKFNCEIDANLCKISLHNCIVFVLIVGL